MSSPLWGGRFAEPPDPAMLEFTSSVGVDVRLLEQDVKATRAHARVLVRAGLLEDDDLPSIDEALERLLDEWRGGRVSPEPQDEDVHSFVERYLTEQLGDLGKRIHAGRSRNDLVATDLRLWCRQACDLLRADLEELIETICELAEHHADAVMPGYTHLQRAQPVSLGFHLLAHGFALARDITRMEAARVAADVSTLGAGALAGNTLGLDPQVASDELAFARPFDNAMDAVADRDFVCDLLYACTTCLVHLSRLAEEIVLWTSAEFGFARIADAWSTGSSMMPQKRNPDVAELVRGKTAGAVADLTGLLVLIKGLPLAYNRDLQEDKGYMFRGVDRARASVKAMSSLLRALSFEAEAMQAAARGGGAWATDLAEALVVGGTPFRSAHEAAGAAVAASEQGRADELDPEARRFAQREPAESVGARSGPGGPAGERVREQVAVLRERLSPYGSS